MSTEECIVCDDQFVDADEILSPDGVSYRDTFLKCSQCDEQISGNNYSSLDGNLYCKPHFEQKVKKNRRLPRGLSQLLPKPSELRAIRKENIRAKGDDELVTTTNQLQPSQLHPLVACNWIQDSSYESLNAKSRL
ncbi:zinc finger, LIM-type [Artemisia annua]|uniref:Zinc finger, LIM-type n=1 Tax=Artemisia annua TaxID=35608 RepID=A0A2U1KCU4_ARTAN|nr:zinc finger, LIM-type [Artemisia annua]